MSLNYEILAPAGGMESLYAAVRCGADAVYVGGKSFSARANADNFTDEEMKQAAEYCHLHGIKLFRAMNTVIFDSETEDFFRAVIYSAEIGVDGLIIQDTGAAALARAAVSEMPLHASTQMTIHTPCGAMEAAKLGFCRVVAARELSLREIRRICDTGIEIEAFVHGAQCMSVSGQCYMSAVIGSRSANRGQCVQACRLPFSAVDRSTDGDRYDLSLKDMSYVERVKELLNAGVFSLKIEGRMKRAEYTAAAVTALKDSILGDRELPDDMKRLRAVFSRSGFTDGYLSGRINRDMFGFRRKEDVESAKDVLPQLSQLYRNEAEIGKIHFLCTLKAGEKSRLDFSVNGISGSVFGAEVQRAVTRPTTAEDVIKCLSKLGGTAYKFGEADTDIEDNAMLPISALNALRRSAVEYIDREIISDNTPIYSISRNMPSVRERSDAVTESPAIWVICRNAALVPCVAGTSAEKIIIPLDEFERLDFEGGYDRFAVMPPAFTFDEGRMTDRLMNIYKKGCRQLWCENIAHIRIAEDIGMATLGSPRLNAANSYACDEYGKMGIMSLCVSAELRTGQIRALKSPIPIGIYAYGRMPLMLTVNCPIKAQAGCRHCTGAVTDRTGRKFPVRCCGEYTELLNCDFLDVLDRLEDFGKIDFALVDLTEEISEAQAAMLAKGCDVRTELPHGERYTKGLYYRGII
ncbi:MAG: U32 family peptidase [Oscillospiraceae bacterium]|nr:U32 family peptidase [Oscillospiraceae bacterium]